MWKIKEDLFAREEDLFIYLILLLYPYQKLGTEIGKEVYCLCFV